ncbi:MAG: hypothetical protein Harvfovirus19_22 [Harvfovirus sp.]|uniref:Uncharacterized protein n=1 Tax=Harvfovirus sp. TaxID=2487768 RepID=A0A3G5A1T2_9VIRU|nr:MAG: hypothetical protein Harvfovirus19_22 [Harvfovirus sp.]
MKISVRECPFKMFRFNRGDCVMHGYLVVAKADKYEIDDAVALMMRERKIAVDSRVGSSESTSVFKSLSEATSVEDELKALEERKVYLLRCQVLGVKYLCTEKMIFNEVSQRIVKRLGEIEEKERVERERSRIKLENEMKVAKAIREEKRVEKKEARIAELRPYAERCVEFARERCWPTVENDSIFTSARRLERIVKRVHQEYNRELLRGEEKGCGKTDECDFVQGSKKCNCGQSTMKFVIPKINWNDCAIFSLDSKEAMGKIVWV